METASVVVFGDRVEGDGADCCVVLAVVVGLPRLRGGDCCWGDDIRGLLLV
jgi:hypothetical protein